MGCWMTYQRMRARAGTAPRETDRAQMYARGPLAGDMDRMEADYLVGDAPPSPPFARRSQPSPAVECAEATGVDVDIVRKVLAYVFTEQR